MEGLPRILGSPSIIGLEPYLQLPCVHGRERQVKGAVTLRIESAHRTDSRCLGDMGVPVSEDVLLYGGEVVPPGHKGGNHPSDQQPIGGIPDVEFSPYRADVHGLPYTPSPIGHQ